MIHKQFSQFSGPRSPQPQLHPTYSDFLPDSIFSGSHDAFGVSEGGPSLPTSPLQNEEEEDLTPHFEVPLGLDEEPDQHQSDLSIEPPKLEPPKKKEAPAAEKKELTNDIDIYRILEDNEERTTVMVRNIPNKFKQKTLLEMISQYEGQYDYFYLPMDLKVSLAPHI